MNNLSNHSNDFREHLPEMLAFLREHRPALHDLLEPASLDLPDPAELPEPSTFPDMNPLQAPDGRPLANFVLGCGCGGIARMAWESQRKQAHHAPVVVVEPDCGRMLASLLKHDWKDLLLAPGVRFAVGEPLHQRIAEALPEASDPLLEIEFGVALIPGDTGPHVAAIRTSLDSAATSAANAFRSETMKQANRRSDTSAPSVPEGKWKILSVTSVRTTALQHLSGSIMGAANRHGHDATALVTDHLGDPFLGSNHQSQVLAHDPDVCVSFLRPGAMFAPWRHDYPSLVLVSSPPQLLDISALPWSDRELVVVADDTFAEHYRAVGVEPLVRDLATDLHPLTDIEQTPAIACDVCMVGNLSDARAILGNLDQTQHQQLITLAVQWANDPDLDPAELLAAAGLPDDEDGRWQRALAYEATTQRRSLAAIALAAAGFTLRIHGSSDWLSHLAGTAAEGCWHGPIEPGLPMAAAFRAAGVSLNVQSHATTNAMNMRTFDVPAAGGVLLGNDHPALHRAFKVGEEALAFNRIEELPDLVSDVIASPERRTAIGEAGRARVERDHSWDTWWTWAETALRERFGA